MNKIRFAIKYIIHFLTAHNSKGFGIHSPLLYQFTKYVIEEKNSFYCFSKIEQVRNELKKDNRKINIVDFGTGKDRISKIKSIAQKSLKPKKQAQLLYRVIQYFKFSQIVELGTSLGITTSYLAISSKTIHCTSFEGSPEIKNIAHEIFKKLEIENIHVIEGDINKTLPAFIVKTDKIDFVFFDANHQSKAVLNYFKICLSKIHNNSVFVIDDIYWSSDMESAWKTIKNDPKVTSTIDLFHIGIVFFNSDLTKKHYKIRL